MIRNVAIHLTLLSALIFGCATTTTPPAETPTPAKEEATPAADDGWIVMFDGKTLAGWKINENPDSWSVKDGAIVARGAPKSHIFYEGDGQPFTNFILELQVMARNNSNGGVYFHTQFQPGGWPKYGFECQVNNSYVKDIIKTGSLYKVATIEEQLVQDDQWFDYRIHVEGNRVQISINDKVVTDYTEPEGTVAGEDFTRKLASGTFALQSHDPNSEVHYRNFRVKRLP